jgi:lysophospholipase L1-like esterase
MAALGALGAAAAAAHAAHGTAAHRAVPAQWVTSWATAQQIVEPANMLASADMTDTTLRQVVRLSIGGEGYRVLISNTFGTAPLHLKAVHVARWRGGDGIAPESDAALTFGGASDVTIPAGAQMLSDPVTVAVAPLADLAISIRYDEPPAVQTGHPGSRQTSYILPGNHLGDARLPGAKTVDHWYQIAAVEVLTHAPNAGAVVVLGDSITDGRGSTTSHNDRWTNILAAQLQASPATAGLAVLNAGQGGNCVLSQCIGPNGLSRIERDVLAPAGAKAVIVLEGINDIGRLTINHPASPEEHLALVKNLIAAYEQIATRAHVHGYKAYIGTILPFMGVAYYHPDTITDADRVAVNLWIRRQKLFDGVIDFEAALRDPVRPDRLHPSYDSGDFLHPSAAGYRVMGEVAAKVLGVASPKAAPARHRGKMKSHKK